MFSVRERRKSKHKFDGTKVFKTEEVRNCFVNPKIENEVFEKCENYIISSFNVSNISRTLYLLHMRRMNGVISGCVSALQCLFHFIACVSFLSISFFFSYFFVDSTACLGIEESLLIPKIKQWSCSWVPKWSFEG